MRKPTLLGFPAIVALLLVGGLVACSQAEKAGIVLNISTDNTVDPAAIKTLRVTVDGKTKTYAVSDSVAGTLGIKTSPGTKDVLVEGLDDDGHVLANWEDTKMAAVGGKVNNVAVVLTAVRGDAGTNTDASLSDAGGAPGSDANSGSDVPLGTGGSGGTGGVTMSGGTTSTGGVTATGGVSNVGGLLNTGGSPDAGGGMFGFDAASGTDAPAAGGSSGAGGLTTAGGTSSGGSKSTAGVTVAGGTTSGGGSTSTGGVTVAGGTTTSGGSASTGGVTTTGGSSATGGTTKMVATAVAAGYGHSCALINDGTIWCWGRNFEGQLGNGDKQVDGKSLIVSHVPVQVQGVTQAVSVVAGGYHTCALVTGGTLQCWGRNDRGQLGNGNVAAFGATPTNVSGLPAGLTVVAAAAGTSHTCALLSDKSVNCWGDNRSRQLAIGEITLTSSTTPLPVVTNSSTQAPLSGVTSLAATHDHACAIQSGGAASEGPVYCWGYNYDGELGIGTADNSTNVAVKVGALKGSPDVFMGVAAAT